MAYLGSFQNSEMYCAWRHRGCPGHAIEPVVAGLPSRDSPAAGRCRCGEIGWLWRIPLDGKHYCKRCLRRILRIAVYPKALRFPE